ncbi:MAG: T9SS type A sorting domain-containing protein [Chlorobi bacterium]|nr:T9SS type A sorting domain-containing protein [Chlorobiota bacterium]
MNLHKTHTFSLLLPIALLFCSQSFGQMSFIPYDSVKVKAGGQYLDNAWAGGFNSPQFSVIDLDGDGKKDLFCMERNWDAMIKTFLNKGGSGETKYEYAPYYSHKFPIMHNWALLVDYNCDGKEDIFTSVPAGIAVYKNISSEDGLQFSLESKLLRTQTPNGMETVYVSPPDIPALSDIDGDGDLDILSYGILGKYVKYYKNLSIENYGNCDNLEFNLESGCWGHFSESSQDNSITLSDTCGPTSLSRPIGTRHAGSALLAIDLNDNGLKDILISDISFNNMVMLSNGGSIADANMTEVEYNYPLNTHAVDLNVFPAAYFIDIDNDDTKDLLISPNNPNTSENYDNIWLYRNTGSQSVPVFDFARDNFLQNQMIDVGEGSRPVFFDANSDGLQDIVIGNYGYFVESSVFDSKLALLINIGSPSMPEYELQSRDFSNLSIFNFNGAYPCFGDMDNDGDEDMIIGDEDGKLHYFLNNSNAGEEANFVLSQANFMGIDIGETAVAQIIDINRDGKPDLLVGEMSGTVNYFENIGSQENAFFDSNPTNDFFGQIDVMPECCGGYASAFMTTDSVGEFLLYVSSESGWIYEYNNIEGNLSGSFGLIDSLFVNALNPNIHGADINNDGKTELIYGEYSGGLSILKPGIPQWINIEEKQPLSHKISIFPNPATAETNIRIEGGKKNVEILIINTLGQTIFSGIFESSNPIKINTRDFKPGIYIIQSKFDKITLSDKLIIK